MAVKTTTTENLTDRIILRRLEMVPENYTIYNINMKVIWGMIAVKLDEMKEMIYQAGSVIVIPAKTKMKITNLVDDESTILLVRESQA